MDETILFVDDDVQVVTTLQRNLYKQYCIEIASGPEDALAALKESKYAVVVSDLRMPGMNGIEFLAHVKEIAPETTRILLTGQADVEASIAAVNEGSIFRFLSKPCSLDLIRSTLDVALERYRAVLSEQDAVRETLLGTVSVFIDILNALQPAVFGHTARIRRNVKILAGEVGLEDTWELETAAMLSPLGCVFMDPAVLEKYQSAETLTPDELSHMLSHIRSSAKLLAKIPRLQTVAQIIEYQTGDCGPDAGNSARLSGIRLGCQLLCAVQDYDRLVRNHKTSGGALAEMRRKESQYTAEVLSAMERVVPDFHLSESSALSGYAIQQQTFAPIAQEVLRQLRS